MWIGDNDGRPQVTRRARTTKRIMYMYALFFDCLGIVARVLLYRRHGCHWSLYRNSVLLAVVEHYATALPRTGVRGIKLLYDNGPAHTSAVVPSYLSDTSIVT